MMMIFSAILKIQYYYVSLNLLPKIFLGTGVMSLEQTRININVRALFHDLTTNHLIFKNWAENSYRQKVFWQNLFSSFYTLDIPLDNPAVALDLFVFFPGKRNRR